jgi:hypothetical protein
MILVQRAASFRRYSTHALQLRISHLLKFIGHHDTYGDQPWRSVTSLPTLDSAVARLESITSSALPEDYALFPSLHSATHPPPTWLLVRLCSKVRSPADAEKASHLIITYLPYVPPDLRPPVLILVVHILSTHKVLPALDRIVKLFIGLPIFYEYWHFNRLLRALTLYTDSPTDGRYVARLAVLLLKTMTERELSLTRKTYRSLLQNRYVTMELTEELRQRMIRDNIVPDRVHLESLLRVFAHHGSAHDATAYARAIHRLDTRQDEPPHLAPSKQTRPPGSETGQIVPSTTVEYLTHLVHENSQRTQFDADAEWLRFMKTGLSHRFLNKQNTSAAAWAARLLSLSRTWSFSPESLVAFFDWSHAQRFPFRTHTTLSYTIVLRGLLQKRAYALALEVWGRYRRHGTRKLHLDPVALGVGVEVLTRAGHPDRALALIDSLVDGRPRECRTSKPPFHTARRPTVPMSLVNRFARVLSMTNPSSALQLWDHMGILYSTTPDTLSFTIMLDAARQATLNGDSFAGALQELGFDLRFRLPFAKPDRTTVSGSGSGSEMVSSTTADAESLDRARGRSYAKLERSLAVNEGDMWGGERAWRRAHRIFTSALLAGWPALADVRAPARAIRSSGENPATSPLRDLKSFLLPPPDSAKPDDDDKNDLEGYFSLPDDPSHHLPFTPLLPIHPRGAYPSFAPDDATFRAAVLLLGTARCASQIPQTLAWMRALGVVPRVRTLAYALVFWAEVSIGAPLLERLRSRRRREDGGEYVRLVRWMEEWVGVENVPDEAAVGEAMRRVDVMRRGDRRDRQI